MLLYPLLVSRASTQLPLTPPTSQLSHYSPHRPLSPYSALFTSRRYPSFARQASHYLFLRQHTPLVHRLLASTLALMLTLDFILSIALSSIWFCCVRDLMFPLYMLLSLFPKEYLMRSDSKCGRNNPKQLTYAIPTGEIHSKKKKKVRLLISTFVCSKIPFRPGNEPLFILSCLFCLDIHPRLNIPFEISTSTRTCMDLGLDSA